MTSQELTPPKEELDVVRIRLHHLLDIFKLYSKIDVFKDDPVRNHAFGRIGNLVLSDPNLIVELVVEADDICIPCNRLDQEVKRCIDPSDIEGFSSKDDWNKTIDYRLLNVLGIEEGEILTASNVCLIALKKLTKDKIEEVWKEMPKEKTAERVEMLLAGLAKYKKNKIKDLENN